LLAISTATFVFQSRRACGSCSWVWSNLAKNRILFFSNLKSLGCPLYEKNRDDVPVQQISSRDAVRPRCVGLVEPLVVEGLLFYLKMYTKPQFLLQQTVARIVQNDDLGQRDVC
jgi:hypothetical protein